MITIQELEREMDHRATRLMITEVHRDEARAVARRLWAILLEGRYIPDPEAEMRALAGDHPWLKEQG